MTNDSSFSPNQLVRLAQRTLNDLEDTRFRTVRRGYETRLVQIRMQDAAQQIRRLLSVVEELSDRVADLEATPPAELEARQVAAALGDEAVRILEAARSAAEAKIEHGETKRDKILEEARATAFATVQEAQTKGRQIVGEARKVRERILSDLGRKRQSHRTEVEQLRAARDRLLESLASHQQLLDEMLSGMVKALPQAVAAAERAGLRMASEPEVTANEIEAQLEAARYAGLPLTTVFDPPDVRRPKKPEPVMRPDTSKPDDAAADAGARSAGARSSGARSPDTERPGTSLAATDVDQAEAVGIEALPAESVAIPAGSGVAGSDVAIYDIEAESPESTSLRPAFKPSAMSGAGRGPNPETGYARLRSAGAKSSASAGKRESAPARQTSAASAEESSLTDPADTDHADIEAGDAAAAAGAAAVRDLARDLKLLTISEQNQLLDAIRRTGRRAVFSHLSEDSDAYARALRSPLQHFVSAIEVSFDDLDLERAVDALKSTLVTPVRTRLRKLAESAEEINELTTKVRAVYREARSRHANAAAEAAFAAAWSETAVSHESGTLTQ